MCGSKVAGVIWWTSKLKHICVCMCVMPVSTANIISAYTETVSHRVNV